MRLGSGGVPARQRGAPKRPAVLGRVAAAHSDFLRFAVEPNKHGHAQHKYNQGSPIPLSICNPSRPVISFHLATSIEQVIVGL